jgi:hypothetical protein
MFALTVLFATCLSTRDKLCYRELGHQGVWLICIDIELSARDGGILFDKRWVQSSHAYQVESESGRKTAPSLGYTTRYI